MPAVFQLNSDISAMPLIGYPFCPNLTAKWPEFLYIFEHIRAFQTRNLVIFHFAQIRAFKRWKRTIWSRFLPENRDCNAYWYSKCLKTFQPCHLVLRFARIL